MLVCEERERETDWPLDNAIPESQAIARIIAFTNSQTRSGYETWSVLREVAREEIAVRREVEVSRARSLPHENDALMCCMLHVYVSVCERAKKRARQLPLVVMSGHLLFQSI